jgi:homoserine kinase
MTQSFRVRVPASSANLGSGFDLLAVALGLYFEVRVDETHGGGIEVKRAGQLQDLDVPPLQDFLVRSLLAAFEAKGAKPPSLTLTAESEIPIARGLGSSAAALAAGILVASKFLKGPPATVEERAALLHRIEGHPENGAASLAGGLVAAITDVRRGDEVRILPLDLHPSWRFTAVWPNLLMATAESRRVLPSTVPHRLLARSSGRVLMLLRALATGDPELLLRGLYDETHVPYRKHLVRGFDAVVAAAVEAGAAGATLSGSGPTVIALVQSVETGTKVLHAMTEAFEKSGLSAAGRVLDADRQGATTLPV